MDLDSVQIKPSSIIWVLVADGASAQVYRYAHSAAAEPESGRIRCAEEINRHSLTPVHDMAFQGEPLSDFSVGHDARGSKIGGKMPGFNTCEPHLDIHDEVKQNLVTEIASKINKAYRAQTFDNLVIAASADSLGALRQELDAAVLSCVIAEIDKNFTNDTNYALLAHLEETLKEARVA